MKRFGSLLLILCLLISVAIIPANASIGITQHDSEMLRGDFHTSPGITYIPRGDTVFISGNLYVWPGATLWLEGNLWVVGRIYIADDAEISGRNAWQLNSLWQWVVRLFLGGWMWGIIGWIYRLFFPLAPSDWPFY
ncbi:MAG: hypothetical protein FWD06_04145 [Oscillospiraceae bacterium]|nr:hypothetical protein [Oscillospiraceae bacterium]